MEGARCRAAFHSVPFWVDVMTAESEGVNGGQEPVEFICECGDPTCRRTIVLTLAEYEQRRPDPILHPDHETSRLG